MKTETGAPKYFEAIPTAEECQKYFLALMEKKMITPEECTNRTLGAIFVLNSMRPLPLPVGVPTDEEINKWVDQSGLIDNGEKCFRDGLKAMRSRLIPLLSAQAAEIEHWQGEAYKAAEECGSTCGKEIAELKSQLSTEQAKGRENEKFIQWICEEEVPFKDGSFWKYDVRSGKDLPIDIAQLYDLYLSTLTSTDQHEGK